MKVIANFFIGAFSRKLVDKFRWKLLVANEHNTIMIE